MQSQGHQTREHLAKLSPFPGFLWEWLCRRQQIPRCSLANLLRFQLALCRRRRNTTAPATTTMPAKVTFVAVDVILEDVSCIGRTQLYTQTTRHTSHVQHGRVERTCSCAFAPKSDQSPLSRATKSMWERAPCSPTFFLSEATSHCNARLCSPDVPVYELL